jgi:hypothetical protein
MDKKTGMILFSLVLVYVAGCILVLTLAYIGQ